jgi:glycerol-3-phosphate O-acyltransferase
MSLAPPRASTAEMTESLLRRTADRLGPLPEPQLRELLANCVYLERKRFSGMRRPFPESDAEERSAVEAAARALRGNRSEVEDALFGLVRRYTAEVHNEFSDRTYRFATRLLPGMLTRLLTATGPRELLSADFDPASRLQVEGPVERILNLARTHTLVLAPTHLSNLDSPLLGFGIYRAGLPPFIYGAGLNLFTNPAMAFFMSRLGAYTVDRRKKHNLYKTVLKDYSVEAIGRGRHSLFFPGGTRARSGKVEASVKKGLLGTAILAWQEGLRLGRANPEVLVVPCTLSYALVLEASTLIEDALTDAGKSRYIITDDEFSEPRTIARFARKVLDLDASVVLRFGEPLDLLGNPVDDEGRSLDVDGTPIDRRLYVCNGDGDVIADAQRDRVYTARLADRIVDAWHRDNIPLSTHIAAFAAWQLLCAKFPALDTWQLVFLEGTERLLPREALLKSIDRLMAALKAESERGRIREPMLAPGISDAVTILDHAIDRFGRFHTEPALSEARDRGARAVSVAPKLCLYYANRLADYGLESAVTGSSAPGSDA